MSSTLPSDGPDKEIFLRALRMFSEACEPPMLIAECPFSIDVEPGLRGCGEECLDLLASHEAPRSVDEVPFGPDMVIEKLRRPRSRRGPDPTAKPYDASELHAIDAQNDDLSTWRTSSLLRDIRSAIQAMVPAEDFQDNIQSVVRKGEKVGDELGRRGVDVEAVLTDYMAVDAAKSVMMSLAFSVAGGLESEFPRPWVHPVFWEYAASVVDGFDDLLPDVANPSGIGEAEGQPGISEALRTIASSPLLAVLVSWFRASGSDAILRKRLPSSVSDLDSLIPTPTEAWVLATESTWLMERLTVTYLSDWSTDSLKMEWRFRHTEFPPPAPPRVMNERLFESSDIATELADKVSHDNGQADQSDAHYVELAVTYLKTGQRTAAASLFGHLAARDPMEPEHPNNQGFCLLPDSPKQAIDLLRTAAEKGYQPLAVNAANRAIAHAAIGNEDDARQLARRALDLASSQSAPAAPSWLWELGILRGEDPRIVLIGVREYAQDLVNVLSRQD